jgi:hypothetical protein
MRDRGLQGVEAVVDRQQRVPPEGDDDSLVLDRQDGRPRIGCVLRSAVEVCSFHLTTVFGLIP